MKSSKKTISKLPDSVCQHLEMYALSAGAAGVSLLALAQPSEAKVVYRPILVNIPPNASYTLYLGLGEVPLLTLKNHQRGGTQPYCSASLYNAKGSVAGHVSLLFNSLKFYFASALASGAQIGPSQKFYKGAWLAKEFYNFGFSVGPWINVTNRYLGFRFQVKGQLHYGWARLNVRLNGKYCEMSATLTGYAYETVPNTPIVAGNTKGPDHEIALMAPAQPPATLGLLALGAPAMSVWRREDSVAQRR